MGHPQRTPLQNFKRPVGIKMAIAFNGLQPRLWIIVLTWTVVLGGKSPTRRRSVSKPSKPRGMEKPNIFNSTNWAQLWVGTQAFQVFEPVARSETARCFSGCSSPTRHWSCLILPRGTKPLPEAAHLFWWAFLLEMPGFFSSVTFFKNEELFTAGGFMNPAQQLSVPCSLKMKLTLTFSLFLSKLAMCIPSRIAGGKQCPLYSGPA